VRPDDERASSGSGAGPAPSPSASARSGAFSGASLAATSGGWPAQDWSPRDWLTGNTAGVFGGGIFNEPGGTVNLNGGTVTGNIPDDIYP
jgi:hypothetical protein